MPESLYVSGKLNGCIYVATDSGITTFKSGSKTPKRTFRTPNGALLNCVQVRDPDYVVGYGRRVSKLNGDLKRTWHSRDLGGLVERLDCQNESILVDVIDKETGNRSTVELDPSTGKIKGRYHPQD